MGGVGKYKKKMEIKWNYARISKNWEGFGKFVKFRLPKSQFGGVGIVGNRVSNIRKNGVGGPPTISDGRVQCSSLQFC